jgi:N-acetylmuramoyl-L-alanine amidase
VECGFLSNPREAAALETSEYQKTLSVVLTAGWVRFTGDERLESENVVLLQGMRQ